MHNLTPSEIEALAVAGRALQASPRDLQALIEFESSWKPLAANAVTGARGLIQFIPATAKWMGYFDADHLVQLHPTTESQLLGPVVRYLYRWSPYKDLARLCMAVFYPSFIGKAETEPFPERVQKANPGIVTVGDYVGMVRKRLA